MTRLLLATSSPLARTGLEALFRERPQVEIVGGTLDLSTVPSLAAQLRADVVLAEWDRSEDDVPLTMLSSSTAVVLLIDEASPEWVVDAVRSGLRAILPRDATPDAIAAAVEAAAVGLVVLRPEDFEQPWPSPDPRPRPDDGVSLTPREREVLRLLADGLGNKEIAYRLSISEHTVKFHVASVLTKLGAGTRTEAVTAAVRRGLMYL